MTQSEDHTLWSRDPNHLPSRDYPPHDLSTQFEDHTLWHPDTNTNSIYITSAQDYIVSYCRTKGDAAHSGSTINM